MNPVARLGLLAGLAALALAVSRVLALVDSNPEEPSVLAILAVAASIGIGISLAARAARLGGLTQAIAVAGGAVLAFSRLAAPSTLAAGLVPTAATPSAVAGEVTVAFELIRFGAAPVVASPGLVGVLAVVFVVLGACLVAGVAASRPYLASLPSLGFYLLCATLDRRPPSWWTPGALVVAGALMFLAEATRARGGRARIASTGRPLPLQNWTMAVLMVGLVAGAGALSTNRWAAAVPESGLVAWRNPTGFGGGLFAGFSYNLFTSMQQDLAEESPEVLFVARVSEEAPPNEELYWKLSTVETYDGRYWVQAPLEIRRPVSPGDWEASDLSFNGDTVAVETVVRIEMLRMNYIPVIPSPRGLETEDRLLAQSYRSREDGSVTFDARSKQGLTYRVRSEIPQPNLSILASDEGELSPMFANAQQDGLFNLPPAQVARPAPSSRLETTFTALPEEFSEVITALSRQITDQAVTDFEKGLVLEEFFRTNGAFVYDASASTGHSMLDLEDWLLDPDSRNYRRGYCEQFATAMALMARALGIPSRVIIGFSPGTVETQADGAEYIVVRARNAHAWVELFMPGQGWIRFDPTPRADGTNPATTAALGFDPVAYLPEPADPTQALTPLPGSIAGIDRRFLEEGADPTLGSPLGATEPGNGSWWVFGTILMLVFAIPTVKAGRRRFRLRRLQTGDMVAGWRELTDRLRDLGAPVSPTMTPVEVARRIDQGIAPLAARVTASVYGRRQIDDGRSALRVAENALKNRYSRTRWWLSWFRPETLFSGLSIGRLRPTRRIRPTRPVAES